MEPNIKQEFINYISLVHSCKAKVKNRVFVKSDIIYTDFFPEYAKYFGIDLSLLKSMYGMNNSEKLFADEFTRMVT